MNVEVREQQTGAGCFFPSAVGAPGIELRSSGSLAGLYPRIMFYLGRPLGKFIIDDCILNTEPWPFLSSCPVVIVVTSTAGVRASLTRRAFWEPGTVPTASCNFSFNPLQHQRVNTKPVLETGKPRLEGFGC